MSNQLLVEGKAAMTAVLEAAGAGAARRALSRLYGIREFSAPGEHPYVRIEQDVLGPVRLDHLTFGMHCDLDGGRRPPQRSGRPSAAGSGIGGD